ncbi:MAG TPA: ABC transporter ATP-binding protein [Trebonia sp.]|jgi:NitT/TauT family transport system ATP-binding protein|nr:ABC transporter ATP-binding protein [Trebonia sp.]
MQRETRADDVDEQGSAHTVASPAGAAGQVAAAGIEHVYHSDRGAVTALARTDLVVEPGEFVALVGPSGSGKTTLLNIIAGLLTPAAGTVSISTVPTSTVPIGSGPAGSGTARGSAARGSAAGRPVVGYMTQHDSLLPWRRALANVAFPLELAGVPRPQRLERAAALLERVELAGFGGHFPHQLSGGMRQRVSLARALICRPPVLLLDEPFGALDGVTRLALHKVLTGICNDLGTTVLLVTHDLAEAVSLSDRVLALAPRPGRVVREYPVPRPGGPREVRDIYSEPELIALHNQLRASLFG